MNQQQLASIAKIDSVQDKLYRSYQRHIYINTFIFWSCSFLFTFLIMYQLSMIGDHSGLWFLSGLINACFFIIIFLFFNHMMAVFIGIVCEEISLKKVIKMFLPFKEILLQHRGTIDCPLVVIENLEVVKDGNNILIYKQKKIDHSIVKTMTESMMRHLDRLKSEIAVDSCSNVRLRSINKPVNPDSWSSVIIYILSIIFVFSLTIINDEDYGWARGEPASENQKIEVFEMLNKSTSEELIDLINLYVGDSGSSLGLDQFNAIKDKFNSLKNKNIEINILNKIRNKIKNIQRDSSINNKIEVIKFDGEKS